MAVPLPSWLNKAADALRSLADQPWTLFALLLALNAVGRPCSATSHDARLYSLQALNQAEQGAYAADVFLQYGSQDQFSLFSRLVGPLVAALGLRLAFLLLYLVFNTLFVFALFRLVRTMIDDRVVSTLALIFLVTASLPYGGGDIFTVHEQFFTPRIVGSAFTLLALERLLRQHFLMAALLLVAGLLVHPLMAFGGVLIAIGYFACQTLPARAWMGLLLVVLTSSGILLAWPVLTVRLLGSMDDEWHHMIRMAVGYNYPDTWAIKDWINLGVSLALPIAACLGPYQDDVSRRRFLCVAALAGAAGFLTTLAASLLPYALLFQGQPYRVLWILKVLQIPLGFLLIARWSQSSAISARVAALVLLGFFCITHHTAQEYGILARVFVMDLVLIVVFVWLRNASGAAADTTIWYAWCMLAGGCVVGALAWNAYRLQFFFSQRAMLAQHFDLNEWVLFDLISPAAWLVIVCLAAAWMRQTAIHAALLRRAPVALAVLVPVGLFAVENSSAFKREHTRLGSDMAFVREFIQERHPAHAGVPAVYSSLGRPDLLWIDVRTTSYFDILQTAGVMFHRKTAQEIQRRVLLVNKFEMARQRQEEIFLTDELKLGMENLFLVPFNSPAPDRDDLARLCREPGLDYLVIPQEFPGLASANNGRIFVYECQKVRTALALAGTGPHGGGCSPLARVSLTGLVTKELP